MMMKLLSLKLAVILISTLFAVDSTFAFILSSSNRSTYYHHNNKEEARQGGRISTTTSSVIVSSALASTATTTTGSPLVVPTFASIVGNGRIGETLAKAGQCIFVGRHDEINPDLEGTPIIIATRNDDLESIIEKCPLNRRKDLVFVQNGYLDGFLSKHGLSTNTQVLLYMSVPAKGVDPVDGVTTVNPEGLTTATGIHAQSFADRLGALNLKCNVVNSKEYKPAMFEKLMWISTYMLVGCAKGCQSVGEAGNLHGNLIETIVNELVTAVSQKEGITFPEGTMSRLAAYTIVVADFPCGVKEFEWRNKYFYDLGDDVVPTHNNLLKECQANGLLSFELP